jgi:predicted ferric reductase
VSEAIVTKRLLHLLLAAGLLLPGLVFLSNTGDLAYYFRRPVPAGQFPYVLSRLFALYALTLIWLQILLGALRPDLERGLGYRHLVRLHTTLGIATLGLLLGHVALFQLGATIRSGQFPTPNLVPNYFMPYYPSQIAFGATALYLALLGALAAALRRKPWMRNVWRKLHAVNYAVFALGAWHGLAIGSETRLQPLPLLCYFFVATIALAVLWRLLRHKGLLAAPNLSR